MPPKPSQRLIQRAMKHEKLPVGLGQEAIGLLEMDQAVVSDLAECLLSIDTDEILWGLIFSAGLANAGKIPSALLPSVISCIRSALASEHNRLREEAMRPMVILRDYFPDYRTLMLKAMTDSYWGVRNVALGSCRTFLGSREIEPLLSFANDPYAIEESMRGHLTYIFLDRALELIEEMLGRGFRSGRISEMTEAGPVSWRDWKPFLDWYRKHR